MNFLTRMIFEVAPDTISGYFLPNGSLADYEFMTARPRKVSMKTQVAINQLVLIWSFSQQSVTEVWGSNFSFPNQKPPKKKKLLPLLPTRGVSKSRRQGPARWDQWWPRSSQSFSSSRPRNHCSSPGAGSRISHKGIYHGDFSWDLGVKAEGFSIMYCWIP